MTSEIDKYRMDLVGVQEVRWEGSGTLKSGNYTLFYGVGNAKHRSAFKILTGKPTGKTPLGRPRHRWEDNIRMDL